MSQTAQDIFIDLIRLNTAQSDAEICYEAGQAPQIGSGLGWHSHIPVGMWRAWRIMMLTERLAVMAIATCAMATARGDEDARCGKAR